MGLPTDGKRGTGAKEGSGATTSINDVAGEGMDPVSKQAPPPDDRSMEAPYGGYPGVKIISGQGTDSAIGAPMKGTKLGSSSGRKASGGSGRRGGPE